MFLFEIAIAQTNKPQGPSHVIRATEKGEGFFYEAVNSELGRAKHVIYVGGIRADAKKFQTHLGEIGAKFTNKIIHGYRSETVGVTADIKEHACMKVAADEAAGCKQTERSVNHLASEIKKMVLKGISPDLIGHSEGNYLLREALTILKNDNDPRVGKYLRTTKLVMLSNEAPTDFQLAGVSPANIHRIVNEWDGVRMDKPCYTSINKGAPVDATSYCVDDLATFAGSGYWHKLDQYLANKKTVEKIDQALK